MARVGRERYIALACAIVVAGCAVLAAQSRTSPESLFQYATITGTSNSIQALRIPVVMPSGEISYKDVTINFEVDSNGNLSLAAESATVVDAAPLVVSAFKAGSYGGPGTVLGGKMLAAVDGPSVLPGGGVSWSFSSTGGADKCTFPSSATWYVGPLESNPVFDRLKKAGITSTAWSYGVASGPARNTRCTDASSFSNDYWETGTLIGVSQSGNAITVASFTDHFGSGSDRAAPVAQVTYRLMQ